MESVSVSKVVVLAKKYDSLLNKFDDYLKNVLLFKLYESPEKILPDYKKKYYLIAIDKNLISKDDVNDLKYWRNIRNELIHKKTNEITYNKFLNYTRELYNASIKLKNLTEIIDGLVEREKNEDEILIFRSFEEFTNCNYVNIRSLFLYTPNSPKKNPKRILNLYIIGEKKSGKTAILKEFLDTKNQKKVNLQLRLAQIFTILYDNLRPTKYKRVRNAIQPIIKFTKRAVFKTIAIDYNIRDPINKNIHLVVHEANIFNKFDLIQTDMYKGQLVGIIFVGFEPNNKINYNFIYRRYFTNYMQEFNYSDYYFCPKKEAKLYQVLKNLKI